MPNDPTTRVVVVGAGPVGLTAAALLAARGVEVLVLERNATTSDEPKAISLDDESLRTFQAAGVVDRVLGIIVPGIGTRYYGRDGRAVVQVRAARPFRLGHPFKSPFAQPDLERALHRHLLSQPGVEVRMGAEVTGLAPDADGVEVTFREHGHAGTSATVRARYVLGCDGGRSGVRTALGVGMTGRSHAESWLVVDVVGDHHDERYGMHHADPARPHVIMPGRDGRCRYEFLLHEGEGEPGGEVPFDVVERLLAPHRRVEPDQVERAVTYRFHGLVADRWRIGPVFLLGDAAHMMPPFAGQGLNSGIRDAANLCWKIAAVLSGGLGEEVLDSYESERRPHAQATVRLSERLGRIVMTTDSRLARRRDAHFAAVLRDPGTRAFYEEMRYRPEHRYHDGLVVASTSAEVGVMLGQPRVFDTATGTVRPLDDVLGSGWALLGVGVGADDLAAAAAAVGSPETAVVRVAVDDRFVTGRAIVDLDGGLDAEVAPYAGHLVLVRPDRFVAAAWHPGHLPGDLSAVLSFTAPAPAGA
ncbi:bifunctional 3-(3-hydroxy-phenyl)propionate/3-hydroxycinnamic acid hydroxylase [Umezawaea endophytica]|uniref:Bifunctional 3-(3-hydroxy-phenyl)propionate/3-hydroxycinnamic acid hydroxylase n=1 Tax=Umezawaea endophytica TaxID=1654476 RepID=A0A9X2VUH9_9PSEU|nr:bifunctional 3-(3-hydroxy-phenyl)propionate/3-hydroxycinnamic acid hydroxylase [Umezawaea endophytica]MCS7482884.1 bifunctional 3-(3-hydroxy-phenyl)propionate/3-hydroxycinnamic acid hydroxylase [Umezawaea endophytica]